MLSPSARTWVLLLPAATRRMGHAAKGRRALRLAGAGSGRGRLRRVRVCSLYLTYLHRVVNCFHTQAIRREQGARKARCACVVAPAWRSLFSLCSS